jgi:hypothetical protein
MKLASGALKLTELRLQKTSISGLWGAPAL